MFCFLFQVSVTYFKALDFFFFGVSASHLTSSRECVSVYSACSRSRSRLRKTIESSRGEEESCCNGKQRIVLQARSCIGVAFALCKHITADIGTHLSPEVYTHTHTRMHSICMCNLYQRAVFIDVGSRNARNAYIF